MNADGHWTLSHGHSSGGGSLSLPGDHELMSAAQIAKNETQEARRARGTRSKRDAEQERGKKTQSKTTVVSASGSE